MTHQLFEDDELTNKYRLHRPGYPKELFEHITNYYFNDNQTKEKQIPFALDVGCGNGQATVELSSFCNRVLGTDVSANQIAHAIPKDNIEYRCNKAEDLAFLESNSVDLITIATGLHWLDVEAFVEEVKRILTPNTGVFAVWTHTFGTLDNPMADAIYQEFEQVTLQSYWDSKRSLAMDYYQSILPLLPYKSTRVEYIIEQRIETTIGQFISLVQTSSASQTYKEQEGDNAYDKLFETLREKLGDCYKKNQNNNDEIIDINSIKMTTSSPIRLYLMKKNETN